MVSSFWTTHEKLLSSCHLHWVMNVQLCTSSYEYHHVSSQLTLNLCFYNLLIYIRKLHYTILLRCLMLFISLKLIVIWTLASPVTSIPANFDFFNLLPTGNWATWTRISRLFAHLGVLRYSVTLSHYYAVKLKRESSSYCHSVTIQLVASLIASITKCGSSSIY